jgi:eukaryotic-like serine/threonine-protein kinase
MHRLAIALCLGSVLAGYSPTQEFQSPAASSSAKLTGTDTIILADFADSTDGAHLQTVLKRALRTALDESPYLNLVPDAGITAALRKTSYSEDTPLMPEVARELCQRSGGKAYVAGWLSRQTHGAPLTIELKAVDCGAGETLADEQFTAADQGTLLNALGRAAAKLRMDLGEPAETLKRFNTPLSRATSSSFQALNAWNLGLKTWQQKGATAALPLLAAAVKLDPRFTAATYDLGLAYRNAGEEGRARDLFSRAFALRQRASARKRFAIAAQYYAFVTVDYGRAVASFREWIRSYPNDYKAVSNLGSFYGDVCRYKEAIAQFQQARRMNPNDVVPHEDLMEMLTATGEFEKARAAYQEMKAMGLDDDSPHLYLYVIAFLENDPSEMSQQRAWFEAKADLQHELLSQEADAAAYAGHLARAREITDEAVKSALKADNKEQAAGWLLNSAWREELFGNPELAHDHAVRALAIAPNSREGEATAAILLARTGDIPRTEATLKDLERRYSNHTVMQSYWLPCIRAQIALKRKDAPTALKQLETAEPLDTLYPQVFFYSHMPSVVLRAEAYQLSGQPMRAATEWEKVLKNPGIVQLSATAPIARLSLARIYASQTGTRNASTKQQACRAYQDFLSLWQEADGNIPLLSEARQEFVNLRQRSICWRSQMHHGKRNSRVAHQQSTQWRAAKAWLNFAEKAETAGGTLFDEAR